MGIFEHLPDRAVVYEVGPRDGLQNEAVTVGTARKVRLIEALTDAGVQRIEITSFVSPTWIPPLADAEDVAGVIIEGASDADRYSALCPNMRGLERARRCGMREVAVFLSATESHNKRNINKTIDQTLDVYREVVPAARSYGMRVRGYVSTVWGCPYEGEVDPRRALELARTLLDIGCFEISLGDTLGVGTPRQTQEILRLFLSELPAESLAMHMHDTRGLALVNVAVGLEMGIRTFDAAVAGLGGCPYAPGASGNLASEDLVYMLHGLGVDTGVDLEKLWEAGRVAEAIVYRDLPGRVHKAGLRSLAK